MTPMIEVTGLVKRYGDLTAVDDINFTVEEGSLFAFLGPNGAGKSTTINILCTTLAMTAGYAAVNGYEIGRQDDDVRRSIGVVFQNSVLDDLLTVRENISMRASFYGLGGAALRHKLDRIIDVCGLSEFINRPYGKLSGGQRRRSNIARALINTPKVLFLDEPTTGLDPQTRKKVWDTVYNLQRQEGMTVFLTTHYMEEAATADRVAILSAGRIAALDTPAALKNQYSTDTVTVVPRNHAVAMQAAESAGYDATQRADTLVLNVKDSAEALAVLKRLEPHMESFEVRKGDMDAVFLRVTGRDLGHGEERI